MSDCLTLVVYVFNKWLDFVFNSFVFTWGTVSASMGWVIIAISIISIVLSSLLNIPRSLPQNAFYSGTERIKRDTYNNIYRRRIGWLGGKLWRR